MPFNKSIGFSEQIQSSLALVWTNHSVFGKTLLNKPEWSVYITITNAKCIEFHLSSCLWREHKDEMLKYCVPNQD